MRCRAEIQGNRSCIGGLHHFGLEIELLWHAGQHQTSFAHYALVAVGRTALYAMRLTIEDTFPKFGHLLGRDRLGS